MSQTSIPPGTWDGTCGGAGNPGTPFIRSNGRPCRSFAVHGEYRCYLHSAKSVASKVKAEHAMALLRMPVIEKLYERLEQYDSNRCSACGYPVQDIEERKLELIVIKMILDRTGFGPKATIELARQSDGDLDLSLLSESERGQLRAALVVVRQMKELIRTRQGNALKDASDPPAHSTVM